MGLKEYKFGFESENKAVKFLKSHGFEILERNFHSRFGEIDIIAKKDEILHFIEVKATSKNYETAYRITSSKFSKILKTIKFYKIKNLDSIFLSSNGEALKISSAIFTL